MKSIAMEHVAARRSAIDFMAYPPLRNHVLNSCRKEEPGQHSISGPLMIGLRCGKFTNENNQCQSKQNGPAGTWTGGDDSPHIDKFYLIFTITPSPFRTAS